MQFVNRLKLSHMFSHISFQYFIIFLFLLLHNQGNRMNATVVDS